MIAFVEGEPIAKGADYVVVSVGGLGYKVFVPQSRVDTISALPKVRLHTHMVAREDNIALFGVQSESELNVFRHLISVSGVGPKLALAVLSTWSVEQLEQIVSREDVNALATVAGIGKKTAQRLLLELKDKITVEATGDFGTIAIAQDAEAALLALGYKSAEIRPILRALAKDSNNVEELIRRALARLAGGEK